MVLWPREKLPSLKKFLFTLDTETEASSDWCLRVTAGGCVLPSSRVLGGKLNMLVIGLEGTKGQKRKWYSGQANIQSHVSSYGFCYCTKILECR